VSVLAVVLSIVSVLVALAALGYARRADKRQEAAELREQRREGREERQDQREEDSAAAQRQGRPIISAGAISGGPTAERVHHEYRVQNGGAATIDELRLWVEDANGACVSSEAGGRVVVAPHEVAFVAVEVIRALAPEGDLRLMVAWHDADGDHSEWTGVRPRPHA
jgi:type II secretory pathway pseudopilin PulG